MTKGIPTEYAGIRFRSRLEAQWAAFFDLAQWRWQYEPFDLKGYIPDFILPVRYRDTTEEMLVEVKPAITIDDLFAHSKRLEGVGWLKDALVVGASLLWDEETERLCVGHGLMCEPIGNDTSRLGFHNTGPSPVPIERCPRCHSLTIDAWSCDHCLKCSYSPTDDQSLICTIPDRGLLEAMWATAKNRVQWKGGFGA